MIEIIKILPENESQGDFVVINKEDFDPKVHKEYSEVKEAPKKKGKK